MSRTFTPEQLKAIASTGKTIVSASAGSGKTTVMIEKIIRLIQTGCDVKEILAVTFTKKAAAQMKEKLSGALIAQINDAQTDATTRKRLKEQLSEVSTADISTIHSLCARILRSYFYLLDIGSDFRIINDTDAEGTALKNQALDELLEEGYENKDSDFLRLLYLYWRKKSDKTLRKILLSTYQNVRDRADYITYLTGTGMDATVVFERVCEDLHQNLKKKCAYYIAKLDEELQTLSEENNKSQVSLCNELKTCLTALLDAPTYFDACAVPKMKFTANRAGKLKDAFSRRQIERISLLKKKVVKIFDDLSCTLSREEELANFLDADQTARAVGKYVLRLDEKYSALKRERGVLDYADLEHQTLKLLQKEEIVQSLREKYRYVFVDEYQDVNPVQERILSLISNENVFLVGDVKQSIYGFRGSKSTFFLQKQDEFAKAGECLFMNKNFRSTQSVLDAVNGQFAGVMRDMQYTRDHVMGYGDLYQGYAGCVQVHLINDGIEDDLEGQPSAQRGVYSVRESVERGKRVKGASSGLVSKIIKSYVGRKELYDPERKTTRKVRYQDIAILSRKKQGKISRLVADLIEDGIPVTSPTAVNICDFAEIKTLIDILSLLDNFQQDVPLCSALLSPMGNLSPDDLTDIRLAYREEKYFRNACQKYAQEKADELSKKLNAFYARYQHLRTLSTVLDAGELLCKILTDYQLEASLIASSDGYSAVKRIHRFIEEATAKEPLCVHEFLSHLRDLDYTIPYSENGGEDSVNVLTMHASKGLEFPIVILDDLNAPFRGVVSEDVYVEENYQLAPRAYDTERMTKKETLLRRLHEQTEEKNARNDERNLYYVALTRAQYALHLIFTEKTVLTDVQYAKSFADFTDFEVWNSYNENVLLEELEVQEKDAVFVDADEDLVQRIQDALSWEYTHKGYENLPVKSSATALMSEQSDFSIDEFERAIAPRERSTGRDSGIAYHAFLETFDFSKLYDEDGEKINRETLKKHVKACYDTMQKRGQDVSLLSVDKLVEILSNEAFYTLKDAEIYKERQFLVSLPIDQTYAMRADASELLCVNKDAEEMIFQGAIDLLVVGKEQIRIIDYKYSMKSAEQLKEHYAPQLRLYKLATAKILGVDPSKIRCCIVNIYHGFQVDME